MGNPHLNLQWWRHLDLNYEDTKERRTLNGNQCCLPGFAVISWFINRSDGGSNEEYIHFIQLNYS